MTDTVNRIQKVHHFETSIERTPLEEEEITNPYEFNVTYES